MAEPLTESSTGAAFRACDEGRDRRHAGVRSAVGRAGLDRAAVP